MTKNNVTHKVTIELTPSATNTCQANDGVKEAYIAKYLSRTKTSADSKTYVYPEVHRVLARMAKACESSRATIGGYLSEIALEHFRQNRELMQGIFDDNTEDLF